MLLPALVPCSAGFAECYAIYDRIVPQLIVYFFLNESHHNEEKDTENLNEQQKSSVHISG